jgi:hypothetical protein
VAIFFLARLLVAQSGLNSLVVGSLGLGLFVALVYRFDGRRLVHRLKAA